MSAAASSRSAAITASTSAGSRCPARSRPTTRRVELTFYDCRLALDGTSFDDFIGSMLPTKQTSVEFTFGVGASSRDGFFTTGDLPFVGGTPSTAPTSRALTRDAPSPAAALGLRATSFRTCP